MSHYIKISLFTCKCFTNFTYNEYIGPYFLSHVVLRFSPVNSREHKSPSHIASKQIDRCVNLGPMWEHWSDQTISQHVPG
jgi:hypothetical protein